MKLLKLFLLGSLLLGPLACGEGSETVVETDDGVPVRLETVDRENLASLITLSGRLQANEMVEIHPKVAGRIQTFHHLEGETVEAGDTLVELDPTEWELEVRRAEASLAQARARRSEARKNLARSKELFEKNIESQASLDSHEAQWRMADAEARTAQASLDIASRKLKDTQVVAPMAGILQDRRFSKGELVEGEAIFSLIQNDPLRLELNVAEQDLPYVRYDGNAIEIQVDTFPQKRFLGQVDYVAPSLHPEAHTQLIRLSIPNPDSELKPGLFARVEVERESAQAALVIPADALVNLGGATAVFVVDENGTAALRPVRTAFLSGNRAAISQGLKEGEKVVVQGQSMLSDGSRVRILPPKVASKQ